MSSNKVHFIGIGGIGVSALARYFLSLGWKVSGSDMVESEIVKELEKEGALISIGHDSLNIPNGTKLVVYSPAIKHGNPEFKTARDLKIETISYPRALGRLTKNYYTIAVSGSHGKSTTTALIALTMVKAGLDPTVIIGTKLAEFAGKNFRKGESQYLVIEADEWNRSFHNYHPKIIVLTNIDKEHLDTYKNFKGVVAGFRKYLENLPKDGILVGNWQDKSIRTLGRNISKKGIRVVFYNKAKFGRHSLGIPGVHNQENAEAAWATAKVFGIKKSQVESVFKNYHGAWRRLETLNPKPYTLNAKVYSDYAHHPTEIKATLQALAEKHPGHQIICVFQPHQQDRLERLFAEFIHAFDKSDLVVIMPVYKVAGREHKGEIDSFALVQKIKNHKKLAFYAENLETAIKTIHRHLEPRAVVVFMSAGDLDSQVRKFLL